MTSPNARAFFAIATLGLVSTALVKTSQAQVNVESLRRDLRKAPATGSAAATFTGRSGNVESLELGGNILGAGRIGRHTVLGSTQADYARFAGRTTVSKSFIHLRYNYELVQPWLVGEVFAQQQQDKFQRLLLRELVGVGPRFVALEDENLRSAIGSAPMLEYERIAVAPGAPDDPEALAVRLSSYVTTLWQPDPRVRLLATVYVQPRVSRWEDFRVLLESSVETKATKRIVMKIVASARHDSEPPTAVKTTDLEIKNAFALQF